MSCVTRPLSRYFLWGVYTLCFAGQAFAQPASYTYIEINAGNIETDLGPVAAEGDSISVAGSYEFSERLYVLAGYTKAEYDVDFDRTALGFGGGIHQDFQGLMDLYAEILFANLEEDSLFRGTRDDNGYTAEIGLRSALSQRIEVGAALAQSDFFDDEQVSFGLRARAYISDTTSLGVSYAKSEDATSVDFGLRVDL